MKQWLRRFRCSPLYIGLVIFCLGCTSTLIDQKSDFQTSQWPEEGSPGSEVALQFSKVSLISPDGQEVELDQQAFQEQWDQYYTSLAQDSSSFSMENMYTVLAWDQQNDPNVIQLSEQGIKVDQAYYSSKKTVDFMHWIKEQVGNYQLQRFQADSLILEAKDIKRRRDIPEDFARQIIHLLQESSLVKGEARIQAPLYPYYQIALKQAENHDLLIEVLSPTLLSLTDKNDRWLLQLHDSIFPYLTEIIPIIDYPLEHVNYLFQANDLYVQNKDGRLLLSDSLENVLHVKSFIHQFVRLIAQGIETTDEQEIFSEPDVTIYFSFSEGSVQKISVREHSFSYDGKTYRLYGLRDQLEKMLTLRNVETTD